MALHWLQLDVTHPHAEHEQKCTTGAWSPPVFYFLLLSYGQSGPRDSTLFLEGTESYICFPTLQFMTADPGLWLAHCSYRF